MANSQPCLRPSKGAHAVKLTKGQEHFLLETWDRDIKRAARAAGKGRAGDDHDLAQDARIRVLVAARSFPNAPAPYVRAVIANTMRSALRYEFRRFSSQSRLADEVSEELPAGDTQSCEESVSAVTSWVAGLPHRLRDIYRYLYVEERSQREVAKLLRLTQPRIAQLHRSLLALGREQLADLTV